MAAGVCGRANEQRLQRPGDDFWFPDLEIPVGWGQTRIGIPPPLCRRRRGAAGECVEAQSEEGHDQRWSEEYLTYLATRPDSVIAALRAIANSRGAAIVHCAAGKDRTGTVVGLALKVAGVTDEAIMAYFAASAERVPLILARLSKRPAYQENLRGKTADSQSPRIDTMRRLLETLEARYNGAAGWLEQNGWTQEETERLRRKLRD